MEENRKNTTGLTILVVLITLVLVLISLLGSVIPIYADTDRYLTVGYTDPWIFSIDKVENIVIKDNFGSPCIYNIERVNNKINIKSSCTYSKASFDSIIPKLEKQCIIESGIYDRIVVDTYNNCNFLSYYDKDLNASHLLIWIPVEDRYLKLYIYNNTDSSIEELFDLYVNTIIFNE